MLDQGANIKAVDDHNRNVLSIVCAHASPSNQQAKYVIHLLIKNKIQGSEDIHGHTPLSMAKQRGFSHDVIKVLQRN